MVLATVLSVTALAAVLLTLHIEQRAEPEVPVQPSWAVELERARTVGELLEVPLPRARRGYDPVAVHALLARLAAHTRPTDDTSTDAVPAHADAVPAQADPGAQARSGGDVRDR